MSSIPNKTDTTQNADATGSASDVTMIARQSIVDLSRTVVGYELFDRSTPQNAHTAASDAALLFNALSHGGAEALVGKLKVFINCTHDSLAGGHLELIRPDKVVLEVPTLPADASPEAIGACIDVFESLRSRGFRLAFNQLVLRKPYNAWLPMASYIKLDLTAFRPELSERLVQFARTHTNAEIIAERVETQEQFERMAELGVTLFQGFLIDKPTMVQAKSMRPSQATILQLVNLVRRQGSTDEIEELLKRDPALSFNLLKFINSSGFARQIEITSFRHAVTILGLKKLFRWAALLLTTSRAEGAASADGTTAVVRGRLMELLAQESLPREDQDNAFVVGVFSMLGTMLGVPLDEAIAPVALPESVVDALLNQRGVYLPYLALAKACEDGDDEAFAANAEALHLSNHQVNFAHLQALAWGESLSSN